MSCNACDEPCFVFILEKPTFLLKPHFKTWKKSNKFLKLVKLSAGSDSRRIALYLRRIIFAYHVTETPSSNVLYDGGKLAIRETAKHVFEVSFVPFYVKYTCVLNFQKVGTVFGHLGHVFPSVPSVISSCKTLRFALQNRITGRGMIRAVIKWDCKLNASFVCRNLFSHKGNR